MNVGAMAGLTAVRAVVAPKSSELRGGVSCAWSAGPRYSMRYVADRGCYSEGD